MSTSSDPPTLKQIKQLIAESEKRHAEKLDKMFKEMGLWHSDGLERPNLEWVRDRKKAFDKSQYRREKIGMALVGAIAVAVFMWLGSLVSAGFQGWAGKKP